MLMMEGALFYNGKSGKSEQIRIRKEDCPDKDKIEGSIKPFYGLVRIGSRIRLRLVRT